MASEFDQFVAQVEQVQSTLHRFDQQFADLGEMRQELADLETVATTPDRSVTVVAGPSGSIKDIRFTDAAMRQPPQALSGAVMSTLRQAVAEAARRQAAIVDNTLGGDLGVTEQVLDLQAELFGITPEELRVTTEGPSHAPPPPQPVRPPAPARDDDTDDFSQESLLDHDKTPPRSAPPQGQGRPLDFYDDDR